MKELLKWIKVGKEILREKGIYEAEIRIGEGRIIILLEDPRQVQVSVAPGAENPFLGVMALSGTSISTPDFLDWMADRLVEVYGENPGVDFVLSCRERARQLRQALRTPSLSPLNEGVGRTD